MDLVLSNNVKWRTSTMGMFVNFLYTLKGRPFITPEFRRWAMARGCHEPSHCNAWGALASAAAKARLIVPTGTNPKTDDPPGHARKVTEWVARS